MRFFRKKKRERTNFAPDFLFISRSKESTFQRKRAMNNNEGEIEEALSGQLSQASLEDKSTDEKTSEESQGEAFCTFFF